MKTFLSLFRVLFLIALSVPLAAVTFAQDNSLPPELTENSSLEEVLAWLNKTSFAKARIGLHSNGQVLDANSILNAHTTYSEWAVFSQGFKLSQSDGCHLVLRNDAIELIEFSTKYPDPRKGSFANFRKTVNNQTRYAGNLLISLELLSDKKAKAPYRLNEAKEKADLLGTWQTKFIGKGLRVNKTELKGRIPSETFTLIKDIVMEITSSGENGSSESMDADDLTFTFDDKELSEKFYGAFRQAIKLCKRD